MIVSTREQTDNEIFWMVTEARGEKRSVRRPFGVFHEYKGGG